MWCRFALFALCLVAVSCASGRDEESGGSRGQGSRPPVGSDSSFGREGQSGSGKVSSSSVTGGNEGDRQSNREHGGASSGLFSQGSDDRRHGEERITEQTNRGNNQHSGGMLSSGHEHSRPTGSTPNRENEGGVSGGDYERQPFGSSSVSGGGSNRPSSSFSSRPEGGFLPGQLNEGRPDIGHSSGRPTGGSSHGGGHEESRPGFRPDSAGESQHGRPTGGSSHGVGHEESRPGFRPDSAGENQFGRPTGGSSVPSNLNEQFGRPSGESGHSQQSGFQSGDHEGQSGHSPAVSKPNQMTTSRPSEHSEGSGNKDEGKEDEEDVCFPNLGCFKMGKPWKSVLRPVGAPHGPERIQTTLHFYSRENLEKPINITVYPQVNMGQARFDPSKITAMIVHGFSNSGNATWMKDMKNVYLKKVDANVMIVDWGMGARLLNYFQVAGNTRVVGKQLGLFVKYLMENYGADPGKFHLIGHSLGAQICSYLGKEVPGIARLTALDPAQPGFEGFDSQLRLDKTDAEFVDVIHTDARPFIPTLGFGMITPHGHVDFYMNGGYDQPGCVPPPKKELPSIKSILDLAKYPVEVIAKTVACPHARAYEYLTEAFNETDKCIFWGHKADVKNVLTSVTNTVTQGLLKKFTALSTTCSKEDCIPLGFATRKSPLRGVFVVTTANRSPYCISEPGIPPETPPQERKQESFIQKIGKKTGLSG